MRVILDANIFVSYLLYIGGDKPRSHRESPIVQIIEAGLEGQFRLLIAHELMQELIRRVPTKRYLAERIAQEVLDDFTNLLSEAGEIISPVSHPLPIATRDPKDDYLLVYALAGQANYLVTGDDDLLSLGEVEGLTIISPSEFAKLLQANKT